MKPENGLAVQDIVGILVIWPGSDKEFLKDVRLDSPHRSALSYGKILR